MQIDTEQAIKELVAQGVKLSPQPKVLVELQKMLTSDDYSMKDLARIISTDPGIVAMLFKTARSPLFGKGKELTSVEQVLMVIGIR
jgi:HD-like signal output (HDOD) protein